MRLERLLLAVPLLVNSAFGKDCNPEDPPPAECAAGVSEACSTGEPGVCGGGTRVCTAAGEWGGCVANEARSDERCDGLDNDCDGKVDEGPGDAPLQRACWTHAAAARGRGSCQDGAQVCLGGAWGGCDGQVAPSVELCDGVDSDCDGVVDDGLVPPAAALQQGVCAGTRQVCAGAAGWAEPDYSAVAGYERKERSCDGADNDCDGRVDDFEPVSQPLAALQQGVCAGARQVCRGEAGWAEPNYAALAGYELDEVSCDGVDNDCDGTADGAAELLAPAATRQAGVCAGAVQVCTGAGGWVEPDYGALPGYEVVESACDGRDNDCDGAIDGAHELAPPLAALQAGVCAGARRRCAGAGGWVEPDYLALPGFQAEETLCDGLDNDCDGTADGAAELTPGLATEQRGVCQGALKVCAGAQGWTEPDYAQRPGYQANESLCDGLDNDCDGTVDGAAELTPPVGDEQRGVCEGAVKVCSGGQGWTEPDYSQLPGYQANETLCDGEDNDCDGAVDGPAELTPPLGDEQRGVCQGAVRVCSGAQGWTEPDYSQRPGYEASETLCDGEDNDCDGSVDGAAELTPPLGDEQRGVCQGAVKVCSGGQGWREPDYSQQPGYQASETLCDGEDNDCDGAVDGAAELTPPLGDEQRGVCQGAVKVCSGGQGWTEPDYSQRPGYEGPEQSCDDLDNDCNGQTDEPFPIAEACLQDEGPCGGGQIECSGLVDEPTVCSTDVGGSAYAGNALSCGTSELGTTVGAANRAEVYGCRRLAWDGPEQVYAFIGQQQTVTVRLTEQQDDLDLVLLARRCVADVCVDASYLPRRQDESLTFVAEAGVTYYLVVESVAGREGSFRISVDCD